MNKTTLHFSANLSRLRKLAGLTQRALADRVGVTASTVTKWESGEVLPTMQAALQLREVLGVDLDALFCQNMADQGVDNIKVDLLEEMRALRQELAAMHMRK